jgi:hypothetical protein
LQIENLVDQSTAGADAWDCIRLHLRHQCAAHRTYSCDEKREQFATADNINRQVRLSQSTCEFPLFFLMVSNFKCRKILIQTSTLGRCICV